mmetsp:Transcript_26205/g.30046  ORF Transcript_26205/g.30046 Transcript_26205/m.30046 type:complete len:554 (+) Transcript_26205:48-1709(+)
MKNTLLTFVLAVFLLRIQATESIKPFINEFGNEEIRRVIKSEHNGQHIRTQSIVSPGSDFRVPRKVLPKLGKRLSTIKPQSISCDEDKPDFFKMVPEKKANLQVGDSVEFPGTCFRTNIITLFQINENSFELLLTSRDPSDWNCMDWYLVTNLSVFYKIEQFFGGDISIIFRDLSAQQTDHMLSYGLTLFKFCDSFVDTITDLMLTVQLFLEQPLSQLMPGSGIPDEVEANKEFLLNAMGFEWQTRENIPVDYENLDIHPGDVFTQCEPSGLQSLIMYGCGSVASHTTVALEDENGDLVVCESTDVSVYVDVVWGIQCNAIEDYLSWHYHHETNLNHLPLKAEHRANFDNDTAYNFVKSVQGLRYGYENFLFAHFDTPNNNLPPIFTTESFWVVMSVAEQFRSDLTNLVWTDALNMRMGTQGKSIAEIADLAHRAELGLGDVIALVEEEGWVYSQGVAYVCSGLVTATLKRGGVFEGLEIEATEFTPRNLYQLQIFDTQKNSNCTDGYPDRAFCQLFGDYDFVLPGFNSVPIYSHMNERCPESAPDFERTPGC